MRVISIPPLSDYTNSGGVARRGAAQRGPFAYYDESGQLVVRPALVRTPAKCDALLDELGRLLCTSAGPAA